MEAIKNAYTLARMGITVAYDRTEKAQIPKSAGESAGKSARKKVTAGGTAGGSAVSLLFYRDRLLSALLPAVPPGSPLFPGTLPSTLPGLLGDLGFFSPVAGGRDSKARKYYIHTFWFSELISPNITFQLQRELISPKLHTTYSFVIQRIAWKNALGTIFLEKLISVT